MGRGRKKQTISLKEKSVSPVTVNCSVTARNLRTSELGGVIFGCKHSTIQECFKSLLFGLPGPHYSYVKNIRPGLPLFLFNYSDRKLHGIFEAASYGGWNINPHAWIDESEPTQFSAQVKVQVQLRCEPLLEDQFSPVISGNYFQEKLFWFELDKNQTSKLISLFSSRPAALSRHCKPTHKWETAQESFGTPIARQGGELSSVSAGIIRQEGESNESSSVKLCVMSGVGSNPPQKLWSSLFRSGNGIADSHGESSKVHSDETVGAILPEGPWDALFSREADNAGETESDTWEDHESLPKNTWDVLLSREADNAGEMESDTWEGHESLPKKTWAALLSREADDRRKTAAETDTWEDHEPHPLELWDTLCTVIDDAKEVAAETNSWEDPELLSKTPKDTLCTDVDDAREMAAETNPWEDPALLSKTPKEVSLLQGCRQGFWNLSSDGKEITKEDSHGDDLVVQPLRENVLDTVIKLSIKVEDLKLSQSMQDEKINHLEHELEKSRMETQELRDWCTRLEAMVPWRELEHGEWTI